MRKIYVTTMILLTLSAASLAQVRVGPFLGYGDGLGLWGLGVHTELLVSEKLSINPVFIQYFPKALTGAFRKSAWELDLNANYYLINGEVGKLYGLGGINYTQIRFRDRNSMMEEAVTDGNLGLNLGLGTIFLINNIMPFAEAKYTVGGYSQLTVFVGVKFQLGESTLEDDY